MATNNVPVTLDTLIVVKIQLQGNTRRFKVPLRDLGASVFPDKVRLDAADAATARVVQAAWRRHSSLPIAPNSSQ